MQQSLIIKDRSFYGRMTKLSLPLIFQSLLLVGVNAINSLMMGQFGETEMLAVSQGAQIFYIISVMSNGLSSPLSVLVSQYWGKKDETALKTVVATSFRWAAIFGLFFGVAIFAFPGGFMRIFSSDPAVLELGIKYLAIIAFTLLPYALSNTVYGYARGTGQVNFVFLSNTLTYSLTILLNYLLIYGKLGLPALGVVGLAIGTLVARVFEMLFCLGWFLLKNKAVGFRVKDISLRSNMLRADYARVTAPIMGHEVVWSIGVSAAQMILGQLSTFAASAYNIAYVLNQLFSSITYGMSGASLIMVGNAIGEGDIDHAKRASRSYMLVAGVIGFIGMILMYALSGPFISLYKGLLPETVGYARAIMPIMSVVLFFMAWESVGLVGILRAGGDGKTGFIVDIFTMWLMAIPLGLLAAFVWKLSPVWVILLLKLDMPIKSIVALVRTLRMKWIKNLTREQFDLNLNEPGA